MLSEYVSQTQQFLNDQAGQFFALDNLHSFINRSRRRVAAQSGCLRLLPNATLTVPGQEVYPFAAFNAQVQTDLPGAQSILACRSLAIEIGAGGWKPMWRQIPWSDFQARFRIFNRTFYGQLAEPGWWAQYGLGPFGKIYLAPIPATAVRMELDLSCVPAPLLTDNDPEPIPYPWTDAVAYWAAVLCLLQQQRREDALAMAMMFNSDMPMAAAVVCPQMLQTPYGATLRSA
jgi:hypothetical protein